jgi:TusA-related sulfurtransferase
MSTDRELDTRGLNCPLPILKAKKALSEMQSGETLKVISTDPVNCWSNPTRATITFTGCVAAELAEIAFRASAA